MTAQPTGPAHTLYEYPLPARPVVRSPISCGCGH